MPAFCRSHSRRTARLRLPPAGRRCQPGAPQPLTWIPCDDVADAECAFIKVPVDYARPDGATFALRLARMPWRWPAHVLEAVTGSTCEGVVRELLLEPLWLTHSRYFSDEIVGFNVAASHDVVDGQPVVNPAFWRVPRSVHATGGLISSARDQL